VADIETIVIGAGVVGLAVAARLAASGQEVAVLEREPSIGQGISSRNSEVIHAGIYYPRNSLKARLCVQGRQLLYQYCAAHNISNLRTGKLIVANDDNDVAALHALQEKAVANGVEDLQLMTGKEAMENQPGLQCVAALHSPSTGIVDSHSLMLSLQAQIEARSGHVVCYSKVNSITNGDNTFTLRLEDNTTVTAKHLVNSSGLNSVTTAHSIEPLKKSGIPDASFAKGSYFKLAAKTSFTKLIYPAPVVGGLGIHLTIDLGGEKRFGPDVEWLNHKTLSDTDFQVDPRRAESFYSAIRKYWPELPDNSLLPDYAGIRPKIKTTNNTAADFEINTARDHGIKGLVNLYGIESPGLTASLAIAEYVSNVLE